MQNLLQNRVQSEVRSQKSVFKTLPPTPLQEGGDVWEQVKREIREDLDSAYVNNSRFGELAYDKYFRDADAEIIGNRIFFSHPEPHVLREGIKKFQKRLERAFSYYGIENVEFEVLDSTSETQQRPAAEFSPRQVTHNS